MTPTPELSIPPKPNAAVQSTASTLLLWSVLLLAGIARFIHLDADPKMEHWIFYIQDEALWIETARNIALFRDAGLYELSRLHLVLSSGFQAVTLVCFELAGVGMRSARLWSAVSGTALLVGTVLLLRRHASPFALALGTVVLAFEPLTLSMSRVAVPEISSLLFTLLAFAALCLRRKRLGAGLGGLALAVAVSMKGTTVLILPVFVLMAALSDAGATWRGRTATSLAFLAAFALSALAGLGLAQAAGIVQPKALGVAFKGLLTFFECPDPYLTVSRFLAPTKVQHFNLLLLSGAWVGSWVLVLRREHRQTMLGGIFILSAVWALGWTLIWSLMKYSPERYSVHLILPLVIHIVAGLSLWRSIGPSRLFTLLETMQARGGFAFHAWLVLPSAAVLCGTLWALAVAAGLAGDRLLYKLIAFAITYAALALLARRGRARQGGTAAWIALPSAFVLLDFSVEAAAAHTLADPHHGATVPLLQLAVLVAAGAACWMLRCKIGGAVDRPWMGSCALALIATGLVIESQPILFEPTYTIRDASRNLAHLFPQDSFLHSSGAGLLLIETRLHYRNSLSDNTTTVDGILDFDRRVVTGTAFALTTTYRLAVHPRYDARSTRPRMEGDTTLLLVYRNTQSRLGSEVVTATAEPTR